MARALGVTIPAIKKWKAGRVLGLRESTQIKIAQILRCNPEDIELFLNGTLYWEDFKKKTKPVPVASGRVQQVLSWLPTMSGAEILELIYRLQIFFYEKFRWQMPDAAAKQEIQQLIPNNAIAQMVAKWNLADLAERTDVDVRRLEEIGGGACPDDDDLIGLGAALVDENGQPICGKKLFEIRSKIFFSNNEVQNGT